MIKAMSADSFAVAVMLPSGSQAQVRLGFHKRDPHIRRCYGVSPRRVPGAFRLPARPLSGPAVRSLQLLLLAN
jgi:hypothetical protein